MALDTGKDYQLRLRDFPVGAQMLFVAFGALVLVRVVIVVLLSLRRR